MLRSPKARAEEAAAEAEAEAAAEAAAEAEAEAVVLSSKEMRSVSLERLTCTCSSPRTVSSKVDATRVRRSAGTADEVAMEMGQTPPTSTLMTLDTPTLAPTPHSS